MKQENIYLNFIEIDPLGEDAQLDLYKKLIVDKKERQISGKLPPNYIRQYSISIDHDDKFEKFTYNLNDNHDITKKLLLYSLYNSIVANHTKYLAEIKDDFLSMIELVVERYDEGDRIVTLSPYYLKPKQRFGFLIDTNFRENKENSNLRKKQELYLQIDDKGRSNKNYYSDKLSIISKIIKEAFAFEIGNKRFILSNKLVGLKYRSLDKKKYIFHKNGTSFSQFQGLRNYGPYRNPAKYRDIKFYFLFTNNNRGFANQIYRALSGSLYPGTFPGLKEMFNINFEIENLEQIKLSDYSFLSIDSALQILMNEKNECSRQFVIYIEENNHEKIQKDIYYYLKSKVLALGIPLQVLTTEKLSIGDSLKWSASSIGLQIFAKLGGVPWVVEPTEDNCLILGIGQAYEKIDDHVKKHIAYTVCVDSSGLFKKIEMLSSNKDLDDTYYSSIGESIKRIIRSPEYSHYTKCAIHIPFNISNKAINVIVEAGNYLSNKLEVKIAKVNRKNKFFGYSIHNTRVPYESSYIVLDNNEFLVWFEGLNHGNEILYKKIGNPVHVKFLNLKESEGSDTRFLQDILNLSGANWRGFNAKSVPVSIFYSELVAGYTREFRQFPSFDETSLTQSFPWFL
jgi:hypothetical protein